MNQQERLTLYFARKMGELVWTLRELAFQLLGRGPADRSTSPGLRTQLSGYLGPEGWSNLGLLGRGGVTREEGAEPGANT